MNPIVIYKLRHYKNALFKKQFFYIFILFLSILVISLLWINNSSDSNTTLTSECTIPHTGDKCQYVRNHCSEIEGLFNYLNFIYCTMGSFPFISLIIMIVWVVWIFLLFGTSSSSFFSPNLTVIANYFRIPESIAGVTLAALGNGAPDVFGTFSSFKVNSGGLAIGELIGASLFVTILVFGCVSLVSPITVSKTPFIFDMLFFIGAIIYVLIIIIKGNISATDSTILLGYYILYVISVVINNWNIHIKKSKENYHLLDLNYDSDTEESEVDLNSEINDIDLRLSDDKSISNRNNKLLIKKNSKETNNNELILSLPSYNISSNFDKNNNNEINDEIEDNENTPLLNNSNNNEVNYMTNQININNSDDFESIHNRTSNTINNTKSFKEQLICTLFPDFKDWDNQSLMTKIINVFCLPFNLILTLTIPVITPEIQNAYKQQVKKSKESSKNNVHHHHHRHHRHQSGDLQNRDNEKINNQQLSIIVSESKYKNSTLSQSPSFEQINSLVREGMMKKQQQVRKSKLASSFTYDNLFVENTAEPQFHPLNKPQSLNVTIAKRKYKNKFVLDNEVRKDLLSISPIDSQNLKEKDIDFIDPLSSNTNSGRASTSTLTVKSDFNDINDFNSNFGISPIQFMNRSFEDFNDISDNSNSNSTLSQASSYDDAIDVNTNLIGEGLTDEDSNSNIDTTNTDDEIVLSEVWNKWIIVISTTICPLFITTVLSIDLDVEYYHWICSCALSCLGFVLTSIFIRNDQIPSYYCIFSVIGFISGMSWVYVIANEVVAVLQSLGKVLHISDSIMGLSFFAMGNSLGDLITNVSIAKLGFSRMALGACLGTPLLNIILGLGISGFVLTEKRHKALPVTIDSNTLYFSIIGLLICALGTLFFVYFNNFKITRSFGLCTIILYIFIIIVQLIIEIN